MNTLQKKLRTMYSSRAGIRIATTTALLAYPMGCLSFLILPDAFEWVGGALIGLAFLAFFYTVPSYVQRVGIMPQVLRFVDSACKLDELESELRRRAQAFSYQVFSLLIIVGVFYMVISADMARDNKPGGLWMPTVDDHWLAIFFGVLFYVLLLPLFFLAWKLPKPILDDEPNEVIETAAACGQSSLTVPGLVIGGGVGLLFSGNLAIGMVVGAAFGYLLDLFCQRK